MQSLSFCSISGSSFRIWFIPKHAIQFTPLKCKRFLVCGSYTVVYNSLWSHGSPWNSPSQNTGVGSCSFLQGIFPTQGSNPGLWHCKQILYQLSSKGSLLNIGVCSLSLLQGIYLFLVYSQIYATFIIVNFTYLLLVHCAVCWILVPWPGIEPGPSAVKAQSPNYWFAREFPP